ncbi:helix-turn-helix transcriptional regulator [Nocardiaceae bacterium NPDC056970]
MPETPPNVDHLLTTLDVATKCCVAPNTVEHWRAHGRGPAYVKLGNRVRYRRVDVDAWLERQTVHPEGRRP